MPYWSYLWPAATTMADLLTANDWSLYQNVLEIGSGIGLVGLAALSCGLKVTFSDHDPIAVRLAVHNARRNGFPDAEGILLDWNRPINRQFSIILGCEVLYDRKNHEPILNVLQSMMSAEGTCWIGEGGREHTAEFIERADQRGFSVQLLNSDGHQIAEPQRGRFQLLILNRL